MPIRVIESPVDNERLVAFECSGKLDAEDARTVFEAVQAIRDRGQNALVAPADAAKRGVRRVGFVSGRLER